MQPATSTTDHPDLDAPYALDAERIARYRRDGYIKLKHVLTAATLERYRTEINAQVAALSGPARPLAERSTYDKAFLQVENIWRHSEVVRSLVFSRRLAGIATALMGTSGVRLYHDQALYKEAGGGHTPWHADQYYWPLSNDHSITAWIPLQAVPIEMGPLAFAVGSHRVAFGRDLPISDESEAALGRTLRDFALDEAPFDLGEVSFHAGWTFHRAGPNRSDRPRAVMTVIYIDRDARVAEPRNANQRNDQAAWMPGCAVGDAIASPLNPVLFG
jgi:ectoine hydroxylase-related dioxygenase (phytanoyl-CoA dioxygenase family)